MSASTDITNFINSLKAEVRPRAKAGAARGLVMFCWHVIGQAQQLAPQSPSNEYIGGKRKQWIKNPAWTGHSGALRDSATVGAPVVTAYGVLCVLGFNTVYAAVQHENLDFHHSNGQAKYLEIPLRNNLPLLPQFIATEIGKELAA
jgi:hypothetical protein